jgi:predicted DNA-binding protein
MEKKTSIQLTTETRDRLYKLKFRKTYDEFLNELCEIYEREMLEENA